MLLLGGTLIPALCAIASRFFPPESSPADVVAHLQLVDIMAIALVATVWTAVLTTAIGCWVVMIMKGPAYVADRYDLSDSDTPRRD